MTEALPKGWEQKTSQSTGKTYYQCPSVLQGGRVLTAWHKPTEPCILPEGWTTETSRSTGKKYYVCGGKSQYEMPKEECSTSFPTPAAPVAPAPVPPPPASGQTTVTVSTPQGNQIFKVEANTTNSSKFKVVQQGGKRKGRKTKRCRKLRKRKSRRY